MKEDSEIGQHWDLECSLAGHKMILNFGPNCLESFRRKMGAPIPEVIRSIKNMDMGMILEAPKALIICAVKPDMVGNPTDGQIDQWAKEDPTGLLKILMASIDVFKEQYQFVNKTN